MNVTEALQYIHAVCWQGTTFGLARINELLDKMGRPERDLKFVHVAGTNGKGSTCALLASILQKAGYRTGLYTSPYLITFNERMQINGQQISDETLCEITEYVKPFADSMLDHPSEFEIVTAIAFEWFRREQCDIIVCEVGLGGEYDATNVIGSPEAAVLCNIGLDHTEILGDSVEKIAAAKAGIIKPGCDVVCYRDSESVEAVFEARCKEVGVTLHRADFDAIQLHSRALDGQVFSWNRFQNIHLPLLGEHQLRNAAVALTAADVLQARGWRLTDEDIRYGVEHVSWPGRFELVRRDPLFIIDGGHNPQCIEALTKNVRDYLCGRPLTILTGVLADKDYACMYESIAPYASAYFAITPPNPRALASGKLADYLSRFGKPVSAYDKISDGVAAAIAHAKSQPDGAVLCYGSLYMIGEIKAALASL